MVLQDINSYIQEATWQLEHTDRKLSLNSTIEYNTKINTVIDSFKKHILATEKSEFIEGGKSKTKIHKKGTLEDLLLTPWTQKQVTCNFVGYYVQPFLQKLTSCVKDAPDLHIHEDTKAAVLVTMHVKYLHDNIHNQEYIEALKETLILRKQIELLQQKF